MKTKNLSLIKEKHIALLIMVFSIIPSWSQENNTEYYPQGTIWEEAYYHFEGMSRYAGDSYGDYRYMRFTVAGDTVVEGVTYKKVTAEKKVLESYDNWDDEQQFGSYSGLSDEFSWDNTGPYHWEPFPSADFCIREEDNKVFARIKDYNDNKEIMAYDFNWEIGETFTCFDFYSYNQYESFTIDSIGAFTLCDGSEEQTVVNEWGDVVCIRGIGNPEGLFNRLGVFVFDGRIQFLGLVKFFRNGKELYDFDVEEYIEHNYRSNCFNEGTAWEEAFYRYAEGDNEAVYTYLRYTVAGDTVVNDTVYKKVTAKRKVLDAYACTETDVAQSPYCSVYEVGNASFGWDNTGPYHWERLPSNDFCIRTHNWNVYMRYWKYGSEEKKIYDFKWRKGKDLVQWNYLSREYESQVIDSICERTFSTYDMISCLMDSSGENVAQLQYIGRTSGLFMTLGTLSDDGKPQFAHLIRFYKIDETGNIAHVKYEWNPMEEVLSMPVVIQNGEKRSSSNTVYTISGQRVHNMDRLPKGIYIANGKTHIVR